MLQMMNEGRESTITENGSKLVVAPFQFGDNIQCAGGEFDLNDWEGQWFRLYLDEDGTLSTDCCRGHFWQLAEAFVPVRKTVMVETEELDDQGIPVVVSSKVPIVVSEDVTVSVWALPE